MRRSTILSICAAAAVAAAAFYFRPAGVVYSQSNAARLTGDGVISFRVQWGITDTAPRAWDGSLTVSNGELLSLRNWHPRPGDSVSESSWKLATRGAPNFVRRPWEEEAVTPPASFMSVPGVIVDVQAASGTRVSFRTANGSFDVEPHTLLAGAPVNFLGGSVVVDRVPPSEMLSTTAYQNDFPTMTSGRGGDVWVAWVAYRNHGDEILARRFDGNAWGPVQAVTEKPSDVFLAKMGRDRNGDVWVVWSAQVSGNFDLYARRFDGKAWSAIERLTDDPQPDIYPNLASDANGNLWLVWQGFRNGKSDIFARRYDGAKWSAAERVSTSPANDWEPAIAADSTGAVYVAWDTYDKGNYDVMMRRYAGGEWSEAIPIADTPKFEAHVSLACDGQNRLWAAWNESGFEWGKDAGFLVKKEATRLYQWRSMAVAVYQNGAWQEPAADLNASLPQTLREYNDFPIVQADPSGRVWLFFRHRLARLRDVPNNTPAHRAEWEIFGVTYQGDHWSAPLSFPFSQGRIDVRGGFAADNRGSLYAAWHTDNRDFEEFLFNRADVYAARLPLPGGASPEPRLKPRVEPRLTVLSRAHADEAGDLRRVRGYAIQSEGRTYHIYRGDTHRHTEFSMDGNNDGTLQQTYRYAIDAAELDFLGVSDHNGDGGPDIDYINWLEQQMADVLMLPRTFVPLYAYERSVVYPNGHRIVIFAERGNPTLPIPQEEQQAKIGAAPLYAYLKRYGGIAISHTSATDMGTDWRDNDPAVEPLVEIYQGDRVSAEYEGAPKAAYGGQPASAPGGFRPAGYVWNAWAKGYKLGVQASSDHLSTHISYACIIATDYSRQGLADAMRKRHSYGATDNIVLDYRMQTAGREYLQGDMVTAPGNFRLSVKAIGTRPIRQIDIIRNNQFIHGEQPMKQELSLTFVDNQPLPGESYYYVRLIQVDDQMAWSSPIWIRR
jgi:hypothetical protein